jgi:hypothetical protein
MERKRIVLELLLLKSGGMCYRDNLTGPEGGPRSKMDSKDNRSGLANRPLYGRLRPRLVMYLDRCVRLK